VDIFQQWLLLRLQEQFGGGKSPMENAISFESILAMLKPIFEQEDAVVDDDEVRRHLDALVGLGYLMDMDGAYFLTFRAMVYSQAAPSLAQMARDEFAQFVRAHWWKAVGILILLAVVVTVVTVNIVVR
jgi:hypothetical protein